MVRCQRSLCDRQRQAFQGRNVTVPYPEPTSVVKRARSHGPAIHSGIHKVFSNEMALCCTCDTCQGRKGCKTCVFPCDGLQDIAKQA